MRSVDSPDPQTILDRTAASSGSVLPLPRLLLVFAHPDDEVLAMGARMERLAESRLFTVTDGTPRDGADARDHGFSTLEAYRAARQRELGCALRDADLSEAVLVAAPGMPVPDQTAALHLRELTAAITELVRQLQPEAVLTHPYEGGHPDHDACAFAVQLALERAFRGPVQGTRQAPGPVVLEAPFYHAGDSGSLRTGSFLEGTTSAATRVCELSPEQQASKRRRLACFGSQVETLSQFKVSHELFRIAPQYDFTRPPHPGQLFYEQFPWGMTGQRFRELATLAQEAEPQANPALATSQA